MSTLTPVEPVSFNIMAKSGTTHTARLRGAILTVNGTSFKVTDLPTRWRVDHEGQWQPAREKLSELCAPVLAAEAQAAAAALTAVRAATPVPVKSRFTPEQREHRNEQAKARRAARREQTEAERNRLYISRAQLIADGWTAGQIHKHLGDPDLEIGYGWNGVRYLWLREKVKRISLPPHRATVPPKAIDLLAAVFAVNRAAKRYRDAAQKLYQAAAHNFAGGSRSRKEDLYSLKDRGIAEAYRTGRIEFCGIQGALAVYRGEGYVFHSTLQPYGATAQDSDSRSLILVEAKPREPRETRLTDARFTLVELPETFSGFTRLESVSMAAGGRASPWRGNDDDYEDDDEYNDRPLDQM